MPSRQAVIREGPTLLRVQLPQLLVYKLATAETITSAVPSACLLSQNQLLEEHIGGVPFRVLPSGGRAYITGSLLQEALEATVKSKATSFTVHLRDGIYVGDEADFLTTISGSLGSIPGSWETEVVAHLTAEDVTICGGGRVDSQCDPELTETDFDITVRACM